MNGELRADDRHVRIDDDGLKRHRPPRQAPVTKPLSQPLSPKSLATEPTGADSLARSLMELGVRRAYGVIGGGIAQFCVAMRRAGIEVIHTRHETGAAFMATEAHFVTDEPVVVYTTTGPGATNAITGLVSAALDGAKVILVSGGTDATHRDRLAFQETGPRALDLRAWLGSSCNQLHAVLDHTHELPALVEKLAHGFSHERGFLASINFPPGTQSTAVAKARVAAAPVSPPVINVAPAIVDDVAGRLRDRKFVIWVGFGARKASASVRELAERTQAPVMCSSRAKGVFPESHPQYLGVTGMFGSHSSVQRYLRAHELDYVLVLGSRLGQTTSGFDASFVTREGFIHVDLNPEVFGAAYPEVETLGVCAEIDGFVKALLERWPEPSATSVVLRELAPAIEQADHELVHPRSLMAAVQRVVVDGSEALVMAEPGNAFAWANHELRFERPGRYRTGTSFGSMTKGTSGIVGAALARGGPAVALVGDGAMLMGNELSTAVMHDADAKWVVLNDASYGMVHHGMISVGMEPFETSLPQTNFEQLAAALGAKGLRVRQVSELEPALELMLATPGPVVVDVAIDPRVPPPFGRRNEVLEKGWE